MLINKHNLAVSAFASTEESRYTIKGIQVSNEGTVATQGHMLCHITLPNAEDKAFPAIDGFTPADEKSVKPFVLPLDAVKKIASQIPKADKIPILNNANVGAITDTHASIAVTDLGTHQILKPKLLTGQFPSWKRVMPDTEPTFRIGCAAEYLRIVADAVCKFSDVPVLDNHEVIMEFRGPQNAIVFKAERRDTGQKLTALLMPSTMSDLKPIPEVSNAAPLLLTVANYLKTLPLATPKNKRAKQVITAEQCEQGQQLLTKIEAALNTDKLAYQPQQPQTAKVTISGQSSAMQYATTLLSKGIWYQVNMLRETKEQWEFTVRTADAARAKELAKPVDVFAEPEQPALPVAAASK